MTAHKSTVNIWMGAIYLEAQISDFSSLPQFAKMSQPSRCYLVEYDNNIWSWKFFWSKPGEYGQSGNFITDAMKEDPPKTGERYFNDATDEAQLQYKSTLTLMDNKMFDDEQSFMYRQHFKNWSGAFAGGLTLIDLGSVPIEWAKIFNANSPY
tara:strand:+ start:35 stop:493 length:459 start_codon:yes stop_codon:yes gene_type:complete